MTLTGSSISIFNIEDRFSRGTKGSKNNENKPSETFRLQLFDKTVQSFDKMETAEQAVGQ